MSQSFAIIFSLFKYSSFDTVATLDIKTRCYVVLFCMKSFPYWIVLPATCVRGKGKLGGAC